MPDIKSLILKGVGIALLVDGSAKGGQKFLTRWNADKALPYADRLTAALQYAQEKGGVQDVTEAAIGATVLGVDLMQQMGLKHKVRRSKKSKKGASVRVVKVKGK